MIHRIHIHHTAEVLLNIDESIDPCSDFYQFACGGWMNRHTIKEDKSFIDNVEILNDNFIITLRDLLGKKLDPSEQPYVRMIQNFYNSCMDLDAIEQAGSKPLKKILSILGGWPVVEGKNWNENKFDWHEALVIFRKFGYNSNILFSLSVDVDERNNTVNIVKLETPSLSLPDRSYWFRLGLNDTTTAAYYEKMVEAAKYLGANDASAEHELLEVLHFEMILANFSSLSDEENENDTRWDNKYTVKDLQDKIPQIPWLKYLNNLLNNKIYENETLVVDAFGFLKNLSSLITTTEKRVIANYMLWRIVEESIPFLSKEWRNIEFEYNKVKLGEKQGKPRYHQCVAFVRPPWNVAPRKIDIALSAYYLRHYFDEESKDLVFEIAEYIREVFLNILDGITWMDEITRTHAKLKAENLQILIGYPKELLNDTAVNEFFKNLVISNESYYDNIFKIKKWATDTEFTQLRKPYIKGDWKHYAEIEINGFIDSNDNIIQFSPGILQNPFFNKGSPYYLNFGGIGSVIGHEITHGFDNRGRQYDKDGNLADWWESVSDEQFEQKAQCIVDQYNNYTTEIGMKINGKRTEGENIADNGGLKEAYLAYLLWVEENESEQLLPGLKYNQRQLFWISYAHNHCGKARPEALKLQLLYYDHSPYKFRVIGSLSNLEEFSKDFNCPPKSPMNKQPKCRVW